jgi:hypothetical protein
MIKKFLIVFTFVILGGLCYYLSLTTIKKNKVKTKALHTLGVLNSEWKITTSEKDEKFSTTFNSSTILIDGVYTSMEGPISYNRFKLNEEENELYWITKFEGMANSKYNSEKISNDFICHINLYHSDVEHFARMGLNERISRQQSDILMLTKGGLSITFPNGFGYPLYSNEKILVGTQALNLNKKNEIFNVDYKFKLHYLKNKDKQLQPLYMRYVVLALPYQREDEQTKPSINGDEQMFVRCAGPNNRMENDRGEKMTTFWKIPTGKHSFVSNVTKILSLKKEETIHFINVHVHPYATSLELKDSTANSTVFKSIITSSKEKKGIENITEFSSIKGVKLYPTHQYYLIQKVNNTSNKEIDMMASMFLYFYDEDLDKKLN